MVAISDFRKMALSFPETTEEPHFHLASFRWKKKIFATLHEKDNRAMVKLPVADQYVFCSYKSGVFYPVPGTWGQQGSTFVDLKKANKTILKEALTIAYQALLKKR